MRKDGKPPLFNRRTFPFREEIYVVYPEFEEIWMKGSFAVGMGRAQIERKHCAGYKLCLVHMETIQKLKEDRNYIHELKQQIEERANEQTTKEK